MSTYCQLGRVGRHNCGHPMRHVKAESAAEFHEKCMKQGHLKNILQVTEGQGPQYGNSGYGVLTLFHLGRGTLCLQRQIITCGSLVDAPKLLPFHDFVPLNLMQALLESFFGFIFQNFGKLDLEDIWSASILTRKFKKSKKIEFFWRKSYFFLLNLNST